MPDRRWLDLTSTLRAQDADELRGEAVEVLLAEAARCRLADRVGPAVVRLVGGSVLRGRLVSSDVDGYLRVDDGTDHDLLVRIGAISRIDGSQAALRREEGAPSVTIGSRLRATQGADAHVRATLADGAVVAGRVSVVGADHVEIAHDGTSTVLVVATVAVWDVYT